MSSGTDDKPFVMFGKEAARIVELEAELAALRAEREPSDVLHEDKRGTT